MDKPITKAQFAWFMLLLFIFMVAVDLKLAQKIDEHEEKVMYLNEEIVQLKIKALQGK